MENIEQFYPDELIELLYVQSDTNSYDELTI